MALATMNRRDFVKSAVWGLAAASFPGLVFGQTASNTPRQEWSKFKTTNQYNSFIRAITLMKANTNSSSLASWQYWVNVHVNYCPHGVGYFLAWHRGYLYHFERQLRTVSADPALSLPYWDYYTNPRIPSEFTSPTTGNPLYQQRSGTNVYNALDLTPFGPTVYNFQRGTTNAFETLIESRPHNPVHNLIGGVMATMQSPTDPIFYLHHCNIDRLMHAWALPDGKGIPYTSNPYNSATSSPYWAGSFTYSSSQTLARYLAYYPSWLSFSYDNNSKPTSLPPQTSAPSDSPFIKVQAQATPGLSRPANGSFTTVPGTVISPTRRSLGGVSMVGLADNSVSVQLPVVAADIAVVKAIAGSTSGGPVAPGGYRSIRIVLNTVQISAAARNGGFYYNVYLNLPTSNASTVEARYLLGTLGAFEIAGAAQHGSNAIEYPATEVLSRLSASELGELTVSFVRINGENAPRGPAIGIGEVRVEISTESDLISGPDVTRPRNNAYTNGG